MKLLDILKELAYDGNLGFHEMHLFYNKASKVQIKKLEKLLDDDKIKEAWELIQKVTGVKLKGKEFK